MRHFDNVEQTDFVDIQPAIKPMFHCICLMWARSRYYGTNARIITLLKVIGNLFIAEASKNLDPSSLFQGDVDEGLLKLNQVIENMEYFK
jgi:dynein heavy chain, axonemal